MDVSKDGTTVGSIKPADGKPAVYSRLRESRKQIGIVREKLEGAPEPVLQTLDDADERLELVETTLRYDVDFSTAREIREARRAE